MVLEHGVRSRNPLGILQNTEPKVRAKLLIFSISKELLKRKHTESAKNVMDVYNLIEKVHKIMFLNNPTLKSQMFLNNPTLKSQLYLYKHFNFLEKKYAGELGQIMRLFEYNTSPEGLKKNSDSKLNTEISRISRYYKDAIYKEILRYQKLKD